MLRTARAAFTSGLNVTGVVAAVIFAGLLVLVTTVHRVAAPVEKPTAEPINEAAEESARRVAS